MIKKSIIPLLLFCFFTITNSYAFNNYVEGSSVNESNYISTSQIIEEIEKNLLFDNDERSQINFYKKKERITSSAAKAKRSKDVEEEDNENMQISVKNSSKESLNILTKQKLAYNAILTEQYEVAVELYKQILKHNPNDTYAQFALASAYQKLGQFKQAKSIYYELLKINPDNREVIIGNILAMIVEESPNEAIYLLSRLAKQNPESDYIMAQTAYAYTKIGDDEKSLHYLNRALSINPDKNEYRLNIAVIYDKMENYRQAIKSYGEVLNNYDEAEDTNIPYMQVQNRVKVIKNKFYTQ